jgi:tetratricopeptide (TPR) repeat protein
MKPSRRFTFVVSTLLLLSLAASVILLRQVDRLRSATTADDVLYLSSPKILKRLSLGYNGLLADIYWTRAVQYFGARHHAGTTNYALLAPLLTITSQLDPHLIIAYDFGANFLAPHPPGGAGSPEDAIKLVEYGIQNNPDNWKLYYQLGFINYMERKDYAAAAQAFARGSQVPNAHPFLRVLAGQMAQHAGDAQMARALWTTTYQTSNDQQIRANALAHLTALQSDQAVMQLESLVNQVQTRTGRLPSSFNELVAAGILRGVPTDPAGHAYKLMPDGSVQVEQPDDLPFIEKGLPPGYKPPSKPKLPQG